MSLGKYFMKITKRMHDTLLLPMRQATLSVLSIFLSVRYPHTYPDTSKVILKMRETTDTYQYAMTAAGNKSDFELTG